ncbi:MAG TPA: hypothetical protein VGS57_15650 [Thermoanaerobaculia bacterium]|nr:hypothetical protein [Thermoanaerobaculia bacterium]
MVLLRQPLGLAGLTLRDRPLAGDALLRCLLLEPLALLLAGDLPLLSRLALLCPQLLLLTLLLDHRLLPGRALLLLGRLLLRLLLLPLGLALGAGRLLAGLTLLALGLLGLLRLLLLRAALFLGLALLFLLLLLLLLPLGLLAAVLRGGVRGTRHGETEKPGAQGEREGGTWGLSSAHGNPPGGGLACGRSRRCAVALVELGRLRRPRGSGAEV